MSTKHIETEVLSLVTEDAYGLWEILSLIQRLYPRLDEHQAKESARSVLRRLMVRSLIQVYCGTLFAGEERPLTPAESEAALSNDKYWDRHVTNEQEQVRVVATDLGEREYYNLAQH